MSGFGTGSVDPFPVPEKNGLLVLEEQDEVLLADYTRHHSKQLDSVKCALEIAHEQFPDAYFHVAMTGPGRKVWQKRELPFMIFRALRCVGKNRYSAAFKSGMYQSGSGTFLFSCDCKADHRRTGAGTYDQTAGCI